MTLHVYAMKNRLSGIFERPFAENVEPKVQDKPLDQHFQQMNVQKYH